MDVRKKSEPSRWQLIWIQPAHAVVVYALIVLLFITLTLGVLAYLNLLRRTQAVCDPLRIGERATAAQAKSQAGRDIARTFGASADKLGCSR